MCDRNHEKHGLRIRRIVSIGMLAFLVCISGTLPRTVLADGVVVLTPYDADLGAAIRKLTDPSKIQVVSATSDGSANALGVISWDFSQRQVIVNKDGSPHETRDNPYDTKPHIMNKLEQENEQNPPDESEQAVEDEKPNEMRAYPYETKKHVMIAGEKEAEEKKTEPEDEVVEVNPRTMRLYPYDTKKHLLMQGERRAELHPPKSKQQELKRIASLNTYGNDPSKLYPKPSINIAVSAQNSGRVSIVKTRIKEPVTPVSSSESNQTASDQLQEENKSGGESNPLWQGAQDEKRKRAVKYQTTVPWASPAPQPVETNKNFFGRVGDTLSKPFRSEDETSGTVRAELPKTETAEEQKGFMGRLGDTITKPFDRAKPVTEYSLTANLTLANGNPIALPTIITHDDQVMIDIFCRLSSQCALWLETENLTAFDTLRSSGDIVSINDLNTRIRDINKS